MDICVHKTLCDELFGYALSVNTIRYSTLLVVCHSEFPIPPRRDASCNDSLRAQPEAISRYW